MGDFIKTFNGRLLLSLYGTLESMHAYSQALPEEQVDNNVRESLVSIVSQVREACVSLGLSTAAEKARLVIEASKDLSTSRQVGEELDRLAEVTRLEMQAHLFMYIEPSRTFYYSDPQLFGEEVSTNFPSAAFDIEEAGKCLAINRGTACVFHLMRVLEAGIYALAANLGIEHVQQNWQNAIEQIEKAIRGLEKDDDRKQRWSEAAAHFMHVKEAWRNRAAHIGQVYTDEKAQQIFDNVKSFMQVLATRLAETSSDAIRSADE